MTCMVVPHSRQFQMSSKISNSCARNLYITDKGFRCVKSSNSILMHGNEIGSRGLYLERKYACIIIIFLRKQYSTYIL